MKLILQTLLLAFAIFFCSIEPSYSQSSRSSYSSQGSTGRRSGQRGHARTFSIESGQSVESGTSTAPRRIPGRTGRPPSPRPQHSAHSSPENTGTSKYSSSSRGISRSNSFARERYSDTSRPSRHPQIRIPSRPVSPAPFSSRSASPAPFSSRSASPASYQQGQFPNSAHQSETSRDSTSYTFDPASSNTTFSFPQSPRGPFSFQNDSPSRQTSESGSNNNSPHHSH